MSKEVTANQVITGLKNLFKEAISETLPGDEEVFFTQPEAAQFLKVSKPTLIKWKREGVIPFYQHGRKVFFRKSELLKALKVKTS